MKILLLGECSNVHWTLAQGLRALGHEVTVVSDGSKWMNNCRDIDLTRKSNSIWGSIKYAFDIYKNRAKLKGYDVVQIKNPIFIDMKPQPNLMLFNYLKKHNTKVFMGAFGTDYYWIKACLDKQTFRYSDYFIADKPNNIAMADYLAKEWLSQDKKELNIEIANRCDGIIACLYEYYQAYKNEHSDKLTFIAEPVNLQELDFKVKDVSDRKINFFIGIQKDRNQLKGTDIMLSALQKIKICYPDECDLQIAESIPYKQYTEMMAEADVLLDQLYSYTPGMNALMAMAQGLVVVGGGEPEMYELMNENRNHPIINVQPNEKDVFNELEKLIQNKDQIKTRSIAGRQFIEKHHSHINLAEAYLTSWKNG